MANPNPSPATRFGGSKANPQSPGGWKPENTISYQYKRFMNMSAAEFATWNSGTEQDEKTVAMEIAYNAVKEAREDLHYNKEIVDRTEGKPHQAIDHTTGGEQIQPLMVKFIDDRRDK